MHQLVTLIVLILTGNGCYAGGINYFPGAIGGGYGGEFGGHKFAGGGIGFGSGEGGLKYGGITAGGGHGGAGFGYGGAGFKQELGGGYGYDGAGESIGITSGGSHGGVGIGYGGAGLKQGFGEGIGYGHEIGETGIGYGKGIGGGSGGYGFGEGAKGIGIGYGGGVGEIGGGGFHTGGVGIGKIGAIGLGGEGLGHAGVGLGAGGISHGGIGFGAGGLQHGGIGVGAGIGHGGAGISSGGYGGVGLGGKFIGGEEVDKSIYSGAKKNQADEHFKKSHGNEGAEVKHGGGGFTKGEIAVKDVKGESAHFSDVDGGKKAAHDGKEYHGEEHFDKEGKHGGEKTIKQGHKKGHNIKGFKSSHHKDESGKTEEYYDEDHDEGGNYGFDGHFGKFGAGEASSFKGGHEDGKFNAEEAKKSGHFENEHLVDKAHSNHGKFGENKYAGNEEVYGANKGVDEHDLTGHQESSKYFKTFPIHI